MRKMGVLGVRVRVSEPEHDVLVVLSETEGELSLPIVIGPHEGVAIATAQAGVRSPRPGPHDLLLATLRAVDARLEYVTICALREGTFIAELVLSNGSRVDSRASDAIALALRAGVEVWCADDVLDAAAVVMATEDPEGEDLEEGDEVSLTPDPAPTEAEVAQFRQFLDEVEPSDFDESGDTR